MTILVQESVANNNNIAAEIETAVQVQVRGDDLNLDGSFVVPESNAFGHNFRFICFLAIVEEFYKKNHIYQSYEFAKKKKEHYGKLDKAVMSIWECCELLNEYVDESDPDLDDPQIEHLLQTAEAIRGDYPDEDWLHLTALIRDLGKVMLLPTFGEEPQLCDTFPLACAFDESVVHHQVAKGNNTTLPPPAVLFIISFHSFYAMHRSGAYTYLMNDEDKEMLNRYDLYSKSKFKINQEEAKPYYLSLIKKYFPEKLKW
ncbi:hypothetical protein ACOSP7_015245 [Xanthoceras sorbifolium]